MTRQVSSPVELKITAEGDSRRPLSPYFAIFYSDDYLTPPLPLADYPSAHGLMYVAAKLLDP